jgi:LPS export ABC transporter protein LptC
MSGRLFPTLFAALALALSTACENDPRDVQRLSPDAESGVETATGVELHYSDSAVVRVRVRAPMMKSYIDPQKPRRVFPQGVGVEFFGPDRRPSSHLTAHYAVRYDNENRVELRDSVVVWNNLGEKLETQQMVWDDKTERLTADGFVKISRPGEIIMGYGLVSNLDFSRWHLSKVSGTVKTKI